MIQLKAMALSLLVEVPVALLFLHVSGITRLPKWRQALVSASGTLITHPIVWLMMAVWLKRLAFWQRASIVEVFAVSVEALVYWRGLRVSPGAALATSVIANASSVAAGFALRDFLVG